MDRLSSHTNSSQRGSASSHPSSPSPSAGHAKNMSPPQMIQSDSSQHMSRDESLHAAMENMNSTLTPTSTPTPERPSSASSHHIRSSDCSTINAANLRLLSEASAVADSAAGGSDTGVGSLVDASRTRVDLICSDLPPRQDEDVAASERTDEEQRTDEPNSSKEVVIGNVLPSEYADAQSNQMNNDECAKTNADFIRLSTIVNEFNKIWNSDLGAARIKSIVIDDYRRKGDTIATADITKTIAYTIFRSRTQEKQFSIIREIQEFIAGRDPVWQRERECNYQKYKKCLNSTLQYHSDLLGFHGTAVIVGGYPNSDHQLGAVIETDRMKGSIESLYRVDNEAVIKGMKAIASLQAVDDIVDKQDVDCKRRPQANVVTKMQDNTSTSLILKPEDDYTYRIMKPEEIDQIIDRLCRKKPEDFWRESKGRVWCFYQGNATSGTIFSGPEPEQSPWRGVPSMLRNAIAHIYNWPYNVQHPGTPCNKGIQSIGITGMCNLLRSMYSPDGVKWSNSTVVYPEFQDEDRCVVIVGEEKDDGSEPLFVFSDGSYINDVPVQHQEVTKKRGRPCKPATTRLLPIVIDSDEKTVKTPKKGKERERSNPSSSHRELRSSHKVDHTKGTGKRLTSGSEGEDGNQNELKRKSTADAEDVTGARKAGKKARLNRDIAGEMANSAMNNTTIKYTGPNFQEMSKDQIIAYFNGPFGRQNSSFASLVIAPQDVPRASLGQVPTPILGQHDHRNVSGHTQQPYASHIAFDPNQPTDWVMVPRHSGHFPIQYQTGFSQQSANLQGQYIYPSIGQTTGQNEGTAQNEQQFPQIIEAHQRWNYPQHPASTVSPMQGNSNDHLNLRADKVSNGLYPVQKATKRKD